MALNQKLFFLVSGEHPELPAAEVKAVLEGEGFEYKVLGRSMRLLSLEASARSLVEVGSRSLMCEVCGLEWSLYHREERAARRASKADSR